MLLTGFLLSKTAQHLMNSRHSLSQLACKLTPHEMQWRLLLFVQALVQCFLPHIPQVSSFSGQLPAKCPHHLHFMHWMGSCFCFIGLIRLPQIPMPSLINLFAMFTEVMVRIACAWVCPVCLQPAGFIHLALWIERDGSEFTSSTSLR